MVKQSQVNNLIDQPIRTDKVLVKQLLTILFDNAMKYTEEDGAIQVTANIKDKLVYFTVADNGLGISDSDKKENFRSILSGRQGPYSEQGWVWLRFILSLTNFQ